VPTYKRYYEENIIKTLNTSIDSIQIDLANSNFIDKENLKLKIDHLRYLIKGTMIKITMAKHKLFWLESREGPETATYKQLRINTIQDIRTKLKETISFYKTVDHVRIIAVHHGIKDQLLFRMKVSIERLTEEMNEKYAGVRTLGEKVETLRQLMTICQQMKPDLLKRIETYKVFYDNKVVEACEQLLRVIDVIEEEGNYMLIRVAIFLM
jgi:hypothetical protein